MEALNKPKIYRDVEGHDICLQDLQKHDEWSLLKQTFTSFLGF